MSHNKYIVNTIFNLIILIVYRILYFFDRAVTEFPFDNSLDQRSIRVSQFGGSHQPMGNKAVGRARGCPQQYKNDDRFEQSPNRDTQFTQPDRHAVEAESRSDEKDRHGSLEPGP